MSFLYFPIDSDTLAENAKKKFFDKLFFCYAQNETSNLLGNGKRKTSSSFATVKQLFQKISRYSKCREPHEYPEEIPGPSYAGD